MRTHDIKKGETASCTQGRFFPTTCVIKAIENQTSGLESFQNPEKYYEILEGHLTIEHIVSNNWKLINK